MRLASSCAIATLVAACAGSNGNPSHQDVTGDGGEIANAAPNSLDDVIQSIVADAGVEAVTEALNGVVTNLVSDTGTQQSIIQQLDADISGTSTGPFPVISFSALVGTTTLLADFGNGAAPGDAGPVAFNLDPSTSTCSPPVPSLTPVNAALPGLMEGSLPNTTDDPCALSQLAGLAAAFNGMAMQDGSTVTDGTNTYLTVADTMNDLLATHTVTVQAMRYFADFLGLVYNGQSVAAPIWLDTGLSLPSGSEVIIPMPHSSYKITFAGPQINGSIEFFMGIDAGGTAFRADTSAPRPSWTGGRAQYTYQSGTDNAKIVQVMQTASDLRNKWVTQAAQQTLPLGGYGTLGVCMDSSAIIEYQVENAVTLFPLLHPASTANGDYLDAILAALPVDVQGFTAASAVPRIGTSAPMPGSQLQTLFPLDADELSALNVLPAD